MLKTLKKTKLSAKMDKFEHKIVPTNRYRLGTGAGTQVPVPIPVPAEIGVPGHLYYKRRMHALRLLKNPLIELITNLIKLH